MSESGGGGPEVTSTIEVTTSSPEKVPITPEISLDSVTDTPLETPLDSSDKDLGEDSPTPSQEPLPTEEPDSKDKEGSPPTATPIPSEDVTSSEPKKTEEIKEIKRDVKTEITSAKEMIRQKLAHDRKLAHEKDPTVSLIVTDDDIQKAGLTLEQKSFIEIYEKHTKGEPPKLSDEDILKLVDTVREQIANEALTKGFLSGSHLLPLVDEELPLYKKLQETAFIDDPKLIADIFKNIDVKFMKQTHDLIQRQIEIALKIPGLPEEQITHLQELGKLSLKLIEKLPKIIASKEINSLFENIAKGNSKEIVQKIIEFSENPNASIEILNTIISESGIKLDPSKLQQYGKYGLLAAIGLMYALMKSGKEQPQGYQ